MSLVSWYTPGSGCHWPPGVVSCDRGAGVSHQVKHADKGGI